MKSFKREERQRIDAMKRAGFFDPENMAEGARYMRPSMLELLEQFRTHRPDRPAKPIRLADLTTAVERMYFGPDLFDVAPPGVHALLAYRNVHRNTGVLDGTPLAV